MAVVYWINGCLAVTDCLLRYIERLIISRGSSIIGQSKPVIYFLTRRGSLQYLYG